MELLNVVLCSIGSVVILFFLTKLIGNKQISQLNTFDYINGITIGSIAAEFATSLEGDFLKPLIAMVIYAGVVLLLSYMSTKSIKLRRFFTGRTLMLFDGNKMYRENFKKCKMDIAEFLTQCRENGYFDINEIQTVVFETNGKISIMPKSQNRPATPKDMMINTDVEKPPVILIQDGAVLYENLKFSGNDQQWLNTQLKNLGINKPEMVFVASVDYKNTLSAYIKLSEKAPGDIFQ
ncbi:MAG TPA: DUF421 domain-containing protein [Clostridiales bacterium]|nr:DUF421 domain-containing protein [Clostridiales bacterium]